MGNLYIILILVAFSSAAIFYLFQFFICYANKGWIGSYQWGYFCFFGITIVGGIFACIGMGKYPKMLNAIEWILILLFPLVIFGYMTVKMHKERRIKDRWPLIFIPLALILMLNMLFSESSLHANIGLVLCELLGAVFYFFLFSLLMGYIWQIVDKNYISYAGFIIIWFIILGIVFSFGSSIFASVTSVMFIQLAVITAIRLDPINLRVLRRQSIEQNSSDVTKREINCYTVFVFLTVVFYVLYYFNREATDLEGVTTFNGILLNRGQMIYRDFSYYVPPIDVLRQFIIWFMFDGSILPLRIFGVMERAIMFCLLFRLFCRWYKPFVSYISTVLGYMIFNSYLFNSYGDYTQTCQFILLISAWLAIKYHEQLIAGNEKRAFRWLFLAGLVVTQSLMCKQSIGVIALAFMFIMLIVHAFVEKRNKMLPKIIGCVVFSFIISLLPYLIWFGSTGALNGFIDQVFFSSLNSKGVVSKTTSQSSTLKLAFNNLVNKDTIIVWALCIIAIVCGIILSKKNKHKTKNAGLYLLRNLMIVGVAWKVIVRLSDVDCFAGIGRIVGFLFTSQIKPVLFMEGIICLMLLFSIMLDKRMLALVITIITFISWFIVTQYTPELLKELNSIFQYDKTLAVIYEVAFHLTAIYFVEIVLKSIFEDKDHRNSEVLFFIAIAMANAFTSLFGNGVAEFSCNGALFTIPLTAAWWMSSFNLQDGRKKKKRKHPMITDRARFALYVGKGIMICLAIFLISYTNMERHIRSVYSFYWWNAYPITDEHAYTINLDRYSGMRVAKRTKHTLEQVTRMVTENTNVDDFVWAFPTSKIYNILANRMNQPVKASTYFFDTCPDWLAISDLEILKKNNPKMIIWKSLDEGVWEAYERNYRKGGELGQREIQRWFNSVKESDYTLIGHVYNEYVYLRNDAMHEKVYSFFESPDNMAESIEEVTGNIPKTNFFMEIYQFFEDHISFLSRYHAAELITVCLIGVVVTLMLTGFKQWKCITLLMLIPATQNIYCVYYFIFSFILCSALQTKRKGAFEWCEINLMAAIVVNASLQWMEFKVYDIRSIIGVLVMILFCVLVVDGTKNILRQMRV